MYLPVDMLYITTVKSTSVGDIAMARLEKAEFSLLQEGRRKLEYIKLQYKRVR